MIVFNSSSPYVTIVPENFTDEKRGYLACLCAMYAILSLFVCSYWFDITSQIHILGASGRLVNPELKLLTLLALIVTFKTLIAMSFTCYVNLIISKKKYVMQDISAELADELRKRIAKPFVIVAMLTGIMSIAGLYVSVVTVY